MMRRAWAALGAKRWSRRSVALSGTATITAILVLALYDTLESHSIAEKAAAGQLRSQARAVAEQTARSFQAVDVVLKHFVQQHAAGVLYAMTPDELHEYLKHQAVGLIQTDALSVVTPEGDLRASSKVPPRIQPLINLSADPEFVQFRQAPPDTFTLSSPRRSAYTNRYVFPISRKLLDPAGRYDGIITAQGSVDYFQNFYGALNYNPGTRIALLYQGTTLLARNPTFEGALGRKISGAQELAASSAAASAITYVQSPLDGVKVLAAAFAVPDYPMIVVVSRDADMVFADWREQARGSALRTTALAAMAALLLLATMRQLRRNDAARASLEVSQERYALAAAGSNDGIWDWDLIAGSGYESKRARELQGLTDRPETQTLVELQRLPTYHPEDAPRRREAMCEHLEGRTEYFEGEYRVGHEGQWRWVRVRGLCIRDASGKPVRVAGSVGDIDARKKDAIERERLENQLRQAQKLEAIGTLAGGIAHDFNNILAAILGYGELARKGLPVDSPQLEHIDASLAAAARAKSLVQRILAFSRSGMGERVPVHVQSVVIEALDGLSATLPPEMRIERRLAAGDAGIVGDPTQIHQVVMNLCANAQQAMGSLGVIEVTVDAVDLDEPPAVVTSTLRPGRYLRLAVRDSGCGIEPHLLERIFDPFFTTKDVGVGTGLGLSLVHGIVTDLGGGIAVESRVGRGSVFTVYLATQSYVAPPTAVATKVRMGAGETVLLVDDEKSLVRLGEEMLASLGYDPAGFSSSIEALEAFRADPQRFDAVLSDESMPGMTGTGLAAEILALRPGIPIVLMSGFVSPLLLSRARDAGVADVVAKPLAQMDLARCLANALGRKAEATMGFRTK